MQLIATLLLAAGENNPKDLYPQLSELLAGLVAFAIVFFFLWRWVLPRLNQTLEARRDKIQGDLEKAEEARRRADEELKNYRQQLAGAREESNRIIDEARQTADQMRRDLIAKAEQEQQQIVARAQEEVRAERDRVFQELKTQVGELSLALAARMVGDSLDRDRQMRLVDDYIEELAAMPAGGGNGHGGRDGARASGRPDVEGASGLQTPPDAGNG